jgi:hypothetical protein
MSRRPVFVGLALLLAFALAPAGANAQAKKKKKAAAPVSTALPTLPIEGTERYLQTNLQFDSTRPEKISSIHYLRGGNIPFCTRVNVGPLNDEEFELTVVETGVKYTYEITKFTPKPWETHIEKLFGTNCDPGIVSRMSKIDQEGIQQGQALVGMTKEGVRLALGEPPPHATPSLDANTWTYWSSRFNKVAVDFQDGKVSRVRT